MLERNAAVAIRAALGDTPVVLLNGPRQSGKSTLAQSLAGALPGARYVSLDEPAAVGAARNDPSSFVAGQDGTLIIDEVQRAPDLFVAIKASVDRDRRPGRFILTGSSNIFLVPRISESLAGRMEIVPLWPFSQGELEGVREGFIDAVFSKAPLPFMPGSGDQAELRGRLFAGGFPEARLRQAPSRRSAWFDSFVATVLQRDIRDIANLEGLAELPRLLMLLAARTGNLVNSAELSRTTTIPRTTLLRYLVALEAVYLYQPLRAYAANTSDRLTRHPKVHLCDPGLVAHLTELATERLERDLTPLGPLLENFAVMELRKQSGWSDTHVSMMHFRHHDGGEVDIVLEDRAGRIVGVEVKASASLHPRDWRGLKRLQELAGEKFHRGVILYAGREALPLGDRLFALPVEALWRLGARPNAPSLAG